MKSLLMLSVLATSLFASSANALLIGTAEGRSDCMPGHSNYAACVSVFLVSSSTSLPTLIAGADFKEMSQEDRQDYIIAEAQNYVDGIPGEYLLLNISAKELNVSVEDLALEIAEGN